MWFVLIRLIGLLTVRMLRLRKILVCVFDSEGHADTLFHAVGVGMTNDRHTLLIDGLSDDDYYIPSIEQLFPKETIMFRS